MVDVTKCPFFETEGDGHETEYFERCMLKCSGYEPLCEDNKECFYKTKNVYKTISELCNMYFEPSVEYDFINDRWIKYDRKVQQVLDSYVKTIKEIIQVLEV